MIDAMAVRRDRRDKLCVIMGWGLAGNWGTGTTGTSPVIVVMMGGVRREKLWIWSRFCGCLLGFSARSTSCSAMRPSCFWFPFAHHTVVFAFLLFIHLSLSLSLSPSIYLSLLDQKSGHLCSTCSGSLFYFAPLLLFLTLDTRKYPLVPLHSPRAKIAPLVCPAFEVVVILSVLPVHPPSLPPSHPPA